MKLNKQLYNQLSSQNSYLRFEEESICPICKSHISPIYIHSSLNSTSTATVFNFCKACANAFISNYSVSKSKDSSSVHYYYDAKLISSEPNRYSKQSFSDDIINMSPQFDKIYNQALAAETSGLDEIAGLGYRKSLEFLVKDFAIHEHPADIEDIKKLMLASCIKKYIDTPQIKTLAERSTWIGNDEAHYIRKQTDRDVSDMKDFIQATVYFIGMVLITEDAASMSPKK